MCTDKLRQQPNIYKEFARVSSDAFISQYDQSNYIYNSAILLLRLIYTDL